MGLEDFSAHWLSLADAEHSQNPNDSQQAILCIFSAKSEHGIVVIETEKSSTIH